MTNMEGYQSIRGMLDLNISIPLFDMQTMDSHLSEKRLEVLPVIVDVSVAVIIV
jgi:hypothetical protein